MTLLPKERMYICNDCGTPFSILEELYNSFGKVLCEGCQSKNDELSRELKEMIDNWNSREIQLQNVSEELNIKMVDKIVSFELRGDDLEMIKYIKQHVPIENEIVYSWLCYLDNEIKYQLNVMDN